MHEYVTRHHPDWTWCCPALPVSPKAAMALVQALCRDWPKERTAVVGSSLGGFYATYLGRKWAARTVLINPAVHPQTHGGQLIGEFPLWHDPTQTMRFEPHFLDELAAMDTPQLPPWPDCMTLIGTQDEVLDPLELGRYYANTQLHWVEGGDHALSGFRDWLPKVDAFLARA